MGNSIKVNRNPLWNFLIVLMVLMILMTGSVMAKADTNKDLSLITTYISKHYPGCKVKFVTEGKPSITKLRIRKGKKIVYVEVLKSQAKGKLNSRRGWGITKRGSYITYNRRVQKGSKVISYCIWNPYSNYTDDVVAVVDNGIIR